MIVGADQQKPEYMASVALLLRSYADSSAPKMSDCHNVVGRNDGGSGM